jgi:hypothetical protein
VVGAVLVWLWRQGASVPDAGELVAPTVAGLVKVQFEQWTAEQAARQVLDPYPLPVPVPVPAQPAAATPTAR